MVHPEEVDAGQAADPGYASVEQLLADLRGPGDAPLCRLSSRGAAYLAGTSTAGTLKRDPGGPDGAA